MKQKKNKRKGKKARRNKVDSLRAIDASRETPAKDLADAHIIELDVCNDDHDAALLDRVRLQWQFGDWESLARLDSKTIAEHPDRSKLALLAAAGKLQCDDIEDSRKYIELAVRWGCSKNLIARVLVAGAYGTLSRISMLAGSNQQAIAHSRTAIGLVTPKADLDLLGGARVVREGANLGLLPQASQIVNGQLQQARIKGGRKASRMRILETEIELLNHELSLAQQRHQLYAPNVPSLQLKANGSAKQDLGRLAEMSVSQLGQDLWVAEKTGFKKGGFFVEFGATDGVLLSNTWLLEKELGWRGICAEPNPKFYEKLKVNRDCIVSNEFIGGESGTEVGFVLAGAYGGSLEFADRDSHKDKREAYQAVGEVMTLRSISLADFLEKHQAPSVIDYLSIDTEGNEYDVLKSFPFDRWDVRLLTIEHNYTNQREKIRRLMAAAGYSVTEQKWDDWYEKR